ncbi:MAG: exodeoxyribonuclease VII small subunit [Candidatus Pacebacteria bacterium]|nr:exodeoxyribonuclease VII small subunit [Candidatus Paceibacterota bacterium]
MKKQQNFSLTEAMKKLEKINEWFQSEEFDLDEALTKIQDADQLTKQIKTRLQEIENQFTSLKKDSLDD